jgi:HEPN domain-containing protein
MDKPDYINFWIKSSEHDLSSMGGNFQIGRYDWALFIRHLALKKILKALWV